MIKLQWVVLSFMAAVLIFQDCSNTLEPATFSRNEIIGYWNEADTSTFSESWFFSDTAARHDFHNMDTMGEYPAWKISNDSILLTNDRNDIEILVYKKIKNSEMNLTYHRGNAVVTRDFFKE